MTTDNCEPENTSADHARIESPTIVVTLSVVDVQLRRRTEPGRTISWEELFASDPPFVANGDTPANGEMVHSNSAADRPTGEPFQDMRQSGPAMDDHASGGPAEPPRREKIYTVEMAERIARELRALPAIDRRGARKQAFVRRLKEQIAIVQRRGYSIEEIAEHLTAAGFDISARTLKSYLRRAKRSGKRAAKRLSGPLVLRENVS